MAHVIHTKTSEETMALGEELGRRLRSGDVVALFGDLGAGKTTFTKGIARGLKLAAEVHSPTFTLIHEHPGETPLYHVDLYRLSDEREVEELGIEEYLQAEGVVVIEWADKMKSLLPPDRLDVDLRMTGDTERELTFEGHSERMRGIVEECKAICNA